MKIIMNTGGLASTNSYLVADEEARVAVLFDAPDGTTSQLLDEAETNGWDLIGLWLTHAHFDHIADHAVVTQRFPQVKILLHPLDVKKIEQPCSQLFRLPFVIPPRTPDELLQDGQVLELGSFRFTVLHTPGHAPGHVVYHCAEQKLLIGGDLIFAGTVGRYDFPDARRTDLEASIRKIMQLPPDTNVLPGHGPVTTLGDERQSNDFVRSALGRT